MQLFRYYMVRLLKIASANNVRVKMIGDRRRFAQDIIDGINRLEEETKDNTGLTFVIAVNYGGRDEIRRAAAKLAEDVKAGKVEAEDITESVFASYLDTADIPDPDLLIRTSGELRLSNYLLWQLAYTELYVTDCLWPDFDEKELEKAIFQYNKRDRRFGGVKKRIQKGDFYVYNTIDQWYRTGHPCYFLRWKRRRPPFCSDSPYFTGRPV